MLNLLLTSLTTGANIVKKFKENKNDDYDICIYYRHIACNCFLLLQSYESIGLISLCKVMNVILYYCYIFHILSYWIYKNVWCDFLHL